LRWHRPCCSPGAPRGDRLLLPWRTQRWLMLQGCATFAVSYICTYTSEQYLVSGLVAVLFALMVFWNPSSTVRLRHGAELAHLGGRRRRDLRRDPAVLPVDHGAWNEILNGGNGHFLLGLVLALCATIASSVGNVLVIKVREQSTTCC
jgi:drug/metabolite transporter (DMT)-like permease